MLLQVENIEKYYGNERAMTKALNDVSFDVEEGEFIGIMGASGSGKTTLLNCISTIDTVSAGYIYLNGESITDLPEDRIAAFRRDNLGFVFQDANLLDTLTVEENIALPLTIQGVPAKQVSQQAKDMAVLLNIEDTLAKFPYEVSGGQKQRCAVARVLVTNPKIILADEPTGSLDSKAATDLMSHLSDINVSLHATILLVTHDAFSASYANRILFLKDGKIFNEILKGEKSRQGIYHEILDVLSVLGG